MFCFRLKTIVMALSMIAVSVVVRCGDSNDDDDEEERARPTPSAKAPLIPATPVLVGKEAFTADLEHRAGRPLIDQA